MDELANEKRLFREELERRYIDFALQIDRKSNQLGVQQERMKKAMARHAELFEAEMRGLGTEFETQTQRAAGLEGRLSGGSSDVAAMENESANGNAELKRHMTENKTLIERVQSMKAVLQRAEQALQGTGALFAGREQMSSPFVFSFSL